MAWLHRPVRSPPRWLVAHASTLFMLFMVSAIGWLVLIESEFNGGLGPSVRMAWLPWLVVVLVFVHRYWGWLRRRERRTKVVALSIAFWALMTFMTWPHLLAVNALGGGPSVTRSGPVVDKWTSRRTTILVFRDEGSGRDVSVVVGDATYAAARLGSHVRCRFRIGPLGFTYRWRYGDDGRACSLVSR